MHQDIRLSVHEYVIQMSTMETQHLAIWSRYM
jgi:hypothetical protein